MSAAIALLASGHDVIVYPEGTRSRDGSVGSFHSGAAKLATGAGVPLVPVGIQGTSTLLPVHGRPHHARVTVRFGEPATGMADARAKVFSLATAIGTHRRTVDDSRLRQRLVRFASSRTGAVVVGVWAAAEALSWPLLPEFALAVLAVAAPRRAPRLACVAAVGSLAGGVAMYLLSAHGFTPPAVLTTPRMHAAAAGQFAAEGASAVAHQPLSGIPYKVYGAAAGHAHVGAVAFALASVPARGLRILAAGVVAGGFGSLAGRWRRWYPYYLVTFVLLFSAALAGVVSSWS